MIGSVGGPKIPSALSAASAANITKFAVPLCRIHHRLVHRVGNEAAWWKDAGIDPIKAARKLWKQTRVDAGRTAPEPGTEPATADRTAISDGPVVDSQTPV